MKNLKFVLPELIIFLLVLLWIYTASSKLMDFHHFKAQMHNQTLPRYLADILIYTLPPVEILAALLLVFQATRQAGFYLSALLMLLFTAYIGLVLLNYFGRVPCSCGGVLRMMNWKQHFLFNLFFLLLTVYGSYHVYRERRSAQGRI
ncbi:MauE/DoxX family redox-associated membrane protein [Mucilaginibacter sp. HD30]